MQTDTERNTLVDLSIEDDDRSSVDKISDRYKMGEIIQYKANKETETGIPVEELLALSVPEGTPERNRRREARPAYELRYKHLPFNLEIVGKVTENAFFNMVGAAYFDVLDHLAREQPAGQWKPVAWSLKIDTVQKARKRKKHAHEMVEWNKWQQDDAAPGGAKPSPAENYINEQQPQRRMVLTMAFAEIAQIDPTCPTRRRDPRVETGAFFKYERERKLKYLPRSLSTERENAEALIREFYTTQEAGESDDIPAAQLEMAQTLLAGGWKIGQVAETLGVKWQTLKAQLPKPLEV
ncbi:MAG: hypothetical protein KAI25_00245 [Hyphomicrobiaceae bacterium]|nr:hypothetical protein [Hyphomicrobiaceae bacterium]